MRNTGITQYYTTVQLYYNAKFQQTVKTETTLLRSRPTLDKHIINRAMHTEQAHNDSWSPIL